MKGLNTSFTIRSGGSSCFLSGPANTDRPNSVVAWIREPVLSYNQPTRSFKRRNHIQAEADSMSLRRVVVTGMGAVSPNGIGRDAYWKNTSTGVSGTGPITLFDASKLSCRVAAEVKDFDFDR